MAAGLMARSYRRPDGSELRRSMVAGGWSIQTADSFSQLASALQEQKHSPQSRGSVSNKTFLPGFQNQMIRIIGSPP